MLSYHQKEQAVYDHLSVDINETGLYFSLRKNGSKKARRDLFIGTDKSNYFKFSFWLIPISFPGSAGNFIDFCVFQTGSGEWLYKLESYIPKNVTGTQNTNSLLFSKDAMKTLHKDFPQHKYIHTKEKHKMLGYELKPKNAFSDFNQLVIELKKFILDLLPYIDSKINEYKALHPEWKAKRFDVNDWVEFNASYQKRLSRYPEESEKLSDLVAMDSAHDIIGENDLPYFPLNQILYGPPGTGKTYSTINLALRILGYPKINTRDKEIAKFEAEQQKGKIVFTTFHQSMSYEDFVEGIKPRLDNDTSSLDYEIKDGILKSVSKLAIQEYLKHNDKQSLTFDERYDLLLDSISESKDGLKLKSRTGATIILEEVSDRGNITLVHENGVKKYIVSRNRLEKVFHSVNSKSDISNINKAIRAVIGGSNVTAYWAVNEYLQQHAGEKKAYEINHNLSDIQYEDIIQRVNWKEAELLNVDRYVIIIDEINRGNVSGIFGELITLLEQDKRIDQKNRLVLKLPYSKINFALPSNLYIIGTMNTADRSVEALDTALRRRFSFKEVMPNSSVLQTQDDEDGSDDIEGFNLVELLTTINSRIRMLLDRDHKIGHSYFLGMNNMEDLKDVFKNKIIPLLQEYFYNDYSRILLVLGKGFVSRNRINSSINHFAIPSKELDINLPDFSYDLISIDDKFDLSLALHLLFNPTYTPNSESE